MTVELLDRPEVRVPAPLLDAVVRHYDPRMVILFGSRARGDAGPESDWDLLVVVDDGASPEGWWNETGRWQGAATVIPQTRSWFEAKRDVVGSLAHDADEDGIVVWRRPGIRSDHGRRRRQVTAEEQWQEAEAWLERAERDLAAARALADLGDSQLDNTAFHLQQATEKVLKGLLTAKAARFRKVHTLDGLAAHVGELFPQLAGLLGGLGAYSTWVIAGRYHDGPRQGAPITRDNVATLLARCAALLAAARALARDGGPARGGP